MTPYNAEVARKCRIANLRDAKGNLLDPKLYKNAIFNTDGAATSKDANCL